MTTRVEEQPLAAGSRPEKIDRGEVLFRRGDTAAGMHVVVYGRIKLSFVSASAMEKVVDIISPGESFGEAVMFLEKPHVRVLSEPTTGDAWNERTGLVHEAILADFPDLSGCAIYACGSMQMIQTANKPAFLARGLPDDFCFSDVLKPQSMQIPT